jgi:hypothetical protein
MVTATSRQATRPTTMASGVEPPAYGATNSSENATEAAGAMLVIDWNVTGTVPTAAAVSPVWRG